MFTLVDVIFLVLILLLTVGGFAAGFIRTFGNLIGLLLGIFVASFALSWLESAHGISGRPILAIVLFLAVLTLTSYLVGWLTSLIESIYHLLTIIPFLKTFNRLLGAILGFVEGAVLVLAAGYVAETYFSSTGLAASIASSKILEWLSTFGGFVSWIFF